VTSGLSWRRAVQTSLLQYERSHGQAVSRRGYAKSVQSRCFRHVSQKECVLQPCQGAAGPASPRRPKRDLQEAIRLPDILLEDEDTCRAASTRPPAE
jgi:hypothetical protein